MTVYETPREATDDAPVHVSPVSPAEDARTVLINTISWGAVFAGVATVLVVQLMLNLLGVGIGLSLIEPWSRDTPPAEAVPVAAGIWWVVSGIVAALLGGMLAGRLSGRPKESTAGWHGFAAWAVSTLVMLAALGSILAGAIGGAVSTAGSAVGGLGAAAAAVAGPSVLERFEQEVSQDTAGGFDPAALQEAAVSAVSSALIADEADAADARERAAQALSRAQSISIEEARTRYDEMEQRYDAAVAEAEATAKQVAEDAAHAGARISLYGFAALMLGALAAWFGGRLGAVRPTITSDWRESRPV